jgi:tyrosyl-tRNA synthetase
MTKVMESPCQLLERLIALEKATIKSAKQMISFLTAELERLNAAPCPDPEKIDETKKRLAEQEDRLASAEDGLRQVEEDHFQFCSPHQPPL